jgi:hypothetical protein
VGLAGGYSVVIDKEFLKLDDFGRVVGRLGSGAVLVGVGKGGGAQRLGQEGLLREVGLRGVLLDVDGQLIIFFHRFVI